MNPPGTLKPRPYPPLPPWSNLPFQASGIQTSNLISESDVGRETPDTLQNAGTVTAAPSGGVIEPAGIAVASVIVELFGSARLARLPHGCAPGAAVAVRAAAQSTIKTIERFMGVPLGCSDGHAAGRGCPRGKRPVVARAPGAARHGMAPGWAEARVAGAAGTVDPGF